MRNFFSNPLVIFSGIILGILAIVGYKRGWFSGIIGTNSSARESQDCQQCMTQCVGGVSDYEHCEDFCDGVCGAATADATKNLCGPGLVTTYPNHNTGVCSPPDNSGTWEEVKNFSTGEKFTVGPCCWRKKTIPNPKFNCQGLQDTINSANRIIVQLNTFIAQGGLPTGVAFPSVPGQSFTTLTQVRDYWIKMLNVSTAQYNKLGCAIVRPTTFTPITFTPTIVTPGGPLPDSPDIPGGGGVPQPD